MTYQAQIAAVAEAVQAQFPQLELIAGAIQDASGAEASWKLTVYQPETQTSFYFRAGPTAGWMWDQGADIVLPSVTKDAIKLALVVIKVGLAPSA
ncbi:MAG: hypothetical protein LKJ29_04360 [Lactobacillus sp.]|uniref:Uncharacterized protein n=1 Tax=Lacticaseibacillus suilingensis TaxID=2799577 RepID=A0ABW4BDM7_9LACO|nr:hypothetical protein [Lacticaseibacillus suilingensis]MCI1893639.1 hypothetical protein [Lactobacillus sp.]MCI1918210.1 hypothetical protein [Lactobacillus sp.]MCI1941271.1 hypothetical protein [Lactobacillus sp.]MCI1971815.1 hypothetical protein [Lactobacillus sp.]MCI2017071.1 hypothetical protein [Lactobacillus sp.]